MENFEKERELAIGKAAAYLNIAGHTTDKEIIEALSSVFGWGYDLGYLAGEKDGKKTR